MTSTYKSVHILTSIAIVITAVITMPAWAGSDVTMKVTATRSLAEDQSGSLDFYPTYPNGIIAACKDRGKDLYLIDSSSMEVTTHHSTTIS